MIADSKEEERYNNHNDDRPEIDQFCAQDCGVPISQDSEVVALNVTEGKNNVCGVLG